MAANGDPEVPGQSPNDSEEWQDISDTAVPSIDFVTLGMFIIGKW